MQYPDRQLSLTFFGLAIFSIACLYGYDLMSNLPAWLPTILLVVVGLVGFFNNPGYIDPD